MNPRRVSFMKLKLFCEAYICKSYTKTGENMSVSQSVVTRAIDDIEEMLGGITLFEQIGNTMHPTKHAHTLYEKVSPSLTQIGNALRIEEDFKSISIAATHNVHCTVVPILLSFLSKDVQCNLFNTDRENAIALLRRNIVDIAIFPAFEVPSDLYIVEVVNLDAALLVHKDNPLVHKKNITKEDGTTLLNVRTFNLQKVNIIEKGIGTLAIEHQYLRAIKKYFSKPKFDLILYSTPPITFSKVIDFIKKRDNAYSYLLLKDIFPQNAVDMKMIKEGSLLHKMFLFKERRLYEISDAIGCMSEANTKYLSLHNPTINPEKIEVNPNSISPIAFVQTIEEKRAIKEKYGLPLNKKIFVYGGNLGKPQGIDFLIETIGSNKNSDAL